MKQQPNRVFLQETHNRVFTQEHTTQWPDRTFPKNLVVEVFESKWLSTTSTVLVNVSDDEQDNFKRDELFKVTKQVSPRVQA